MTTTRPLGCLCKTSGVAVRQHILRPSIVIRHYSQPSRTEKTSTPVAQPSHVKSALEIIESRTGADSINPPRSTLPPPLNLPTRGSEAAPVYWFRLGRAYGTFYKDGIKAVWFNYKAARLLKERLRNEHGANTITDAVAKRCITRSEFQLLVRNGHDIGKLPFFGLLVLVFGEWLVLIVPFVPNRVPGTCRIPKQVHGMREKAEERRRISFRHGITEPSEEQLGRGDGTRRTAKRDGDDQHSWPMVFSPGYARGILEKLRDDQLHHLSSSLGLHSRIWDRLQLSPPASILRRSIGKRVQYIAQDDSLLVGHNNRSRLTLDELYSACEDRGIDVLGKQEDVLRKELSWWLQRQQEDQGAGRALLAMLFRRLAIREWVQLNVRANSSHSP